VADLLKAFLDATAYRAALLRAGQARGARNVTKLLADAQRSEMVTVGAFLEYVRQLRDVGTREGEAPSPAQGAVQIMSVHAAKGLEFPVVCIGEASRESRDVHGTLVDGELGMLPSLALELEVNDGQGRTRVQKVEPAVYRLALRAARDQDEAESGRLLYVAATRAQEKLLISGVAGRSARGWLKRLDAALPLSELLKRSDSEGTEVLRETWMLGQQPVDCVLYPKNAGLVLPQAEVPLAPGFPGDRLEMPPLLRPLRREPMHLDEAARDQARDPPRRVWRVVPPEDRPRAPSWVVGTLVHGALADWLFPEGEGRDYDAWAGTEARGCGITDPREVRDAVRRAARMLARFQGTDLCARMEAANVRRHEVPYSRIDEQGQLDHGVIDALFREGEGWTLVEFKTDRVREEELEAKLVQEDYVEQVGRYLAAAEHLLGKRPRPVLCLLNFAGTVRLVEDRW
jgi:ATP-dependent exoDNAse (exonuclease V) beta subunit